MRQAVVQADQRRMVLETGTVQALWRWPVKAMGGEAMPSVRVDGRGVGGDRAHAVVYASEHGWMPLTELDTPRLGDWAAAYPFNIGANVDPESPPYALVTSPSGRTWVWGDPRLRFALADDLGRPVELRRDVGGMQAKERTVLVTWGGQDPTELRSNVHLDVELDPALEGGTLIFEHGVRMRLLSRSATGGMYARVLANGRIAAGENVAIAVPDRTLAHSASASGASGR
jgi:hypothetical protein